nr:prolyl-tRNA synthetase associated domain-containing protein [Lachnospiraceae bacterium]
MKLELIKGRPADCAGRLQKEIRTYDLLDRLGIEYERTDHMDMPATTMEACEEIDAVLDVTICKNLFLCNRQKTDFYLLAMPGDKPFKTKDLSAQLGIARLSFATEDFMGEFLDITPGSVSVLGLMNDKENRVRLLVDEEILGMEYFGCHPCINTSSMRLKTKDLLEKFLPAVHHEYTVVRLPRYEEGE